MQVVDEKREQTKAPKTHFDCDVVIVGYGPTGVSAANFLGCYGVKTIALERDSGIYPRARAVTINDWTLRYYQSVGLDQALLRDMDTTIALRVRTYAGQDLFRTAFGRGVLGHPTSNNIYQPAMEQTLRDGAARYADHVSVRFGVDVTGVRQDPGGVTLAVSDPHSGVVSQVRSRYVLACDGGASTLRSQLGIKLLGATQNTKWVVVDARVRRWWPDRHILTIWSDPKRPVVDIALALGNHRWEFPLQAQESEDDFATLEQLWPLLKSMGVTPDDVEIHRHAFYKHHSRYAERWRDGRVFLVGDAAHLMPPWVGQGMQSGIRDAFNISWKLREVLAGRLPASLLDTYESERAPNVAAITAGSERMGRIIKMQMTRKERALGNLGRLAMKLGLPAPGSPVGRPGMGPGWLRGRQDKKSAVGRMIPQPMIATARGRLCRLDDVLGQGFVVLGCRLYPATVLEASAKAGWDALGASYIAVRAVNEAAQADTDIIDLDGTLIAWLNKYRAKAVALRPDRFVAAALDASGAGLDVPAMMGEPQSVQARKDMHVGALAAG